MYLKKIVFEKLFEIFFAIANYDSCDDNLKFYEIHISYNLIISKSFFEVISFNFNIFINIFISFTFSINAKFIFVECSKAFNNVVSYIIITNTSQNISVSVKVFYDDDNVKKHVFDSFQKISFQQNFMTNFFSPEKKQRKKSQKKIEKKIEMISLIDMFNEIKKKYDKFIFIKQIFKNVKIDIT